MNFRDLLRAAWYLQSRSWQNAIRVRLRRLRQPKYLIGAVFGLGYLLMVFGRWIFYGYYLRTHGSQWTPSVASQTALAENTAAAVLLFFCLINWVFAKDRAALAFTEAEVAHLFPAPISRPLLIAYRLVRGQGAILVSTLLLMVFSGRVTLGVGAIIPALGWWLVLSLLSLHGLGASFAIQRITERGLAGWRRRLVTLAVPLGITALLWLWYQALPPIPGLSAESNLTERLAAFGQRVFTSGPAPWLLWPFRLAVRPLFAEGVLDALPRLAPAVGLVALHAFWVLRSAVSFEEASEALARRTAELRQKKGSGAVNVKPPPKANPEPFTLAPLGPPWVALWWRGLLESRIHWRKWLGIIGLTFGGLVAARLFLPPPTILPIVGGWCAGSFLILILGGANLAARRVTQELRQIEVAKSFPLPGYQVVLGALLGGLTGSFFWQLLLAALSALLLGTTTGELAVPAADWISLHVAALFLGPTMMFLVSLMTTVPPILFPAWFATASAGARGFENSGQMMLVGLFQITLLLGALIAPSLGALLSYWILTYLVSPVLALPLASAVAASLLLGESALLLLWIGRRFDSVDSAEER